jgi:hypothetical protein
MRTVESNAVFGGKEYVFQGNLIRLLLMPLLCSCVLGFSPPDDWIFARLFGGATPDFRAAFEKELQCRCREVEVQEGGGWSTRYHNASKCDRHLHTAETGADGTDGADTA